MSPFTALWVSAAVIVGYIALSTELVVTYTSHRIPLAERFNPRAQRRSRKFLWLDLPLVVFFVGVANLAMVSVALDGSQPPLTRTIAVIELLLAAGWTILLTRRLLGVRPNST